MFQEIEVFVRGKVQMVNYRDFAQKKAAGLGISGEAENLKDGSVHIVAQGLQDALTRYIEILRKGPFMARVTDVEVKWRESQAQCKGFKIKYE